MARVGGTWFLAALGCAVALGGVTACGGRSGGETQTAAVREQKPLPEEPRIERTDSIGTYGGRFVLGETTGPKTFNAMMANETSSTDITARMFVGLVDFDNETQQDAPGLAKSWEVGADGLTWTFHLRKGAAFSDGHPITSSDVLFSFELAYDETLHPSVQDLLITNGKKWEVSAPDDYTIVIKLPAPNAMVVAERRLRAHHAEACARADLQGRKLCVCLQREPCRPSRSSAADRGASNSTSACREDGARAESVLVRFRQPEAPPPLPRRTGLPRRARPGHCGLEVPFRRDRRARQREARELPAGTPTISSRATTRCTTSARP